MLKLSDMLMVDSPRNADLRRLMLICQSEAQVVSVVCVGVHAMADRRLRYSSAPRCDTPLKLAVATPLRLSLAIVV